jgi:hypothetical protein
MSRLKFDIVIVGLDIEAFTPSLQLQFLAAFKILFGDLLGSSGTVQLDAVFPGSVIIRMNVVALSVSSSGDSAYCVVGDRVRDDSLLESLQALSPIFRDVSLSLGLYTAACTDCRCTRVVSPTSESSSDDMNEAAIIVPIVVIALILIVLVILFVYVRRERSRRFVTHVHCFSHSSSDSTVAAYADDEADSEYEAASKTLQVRSAWMPQLAPAPVAEPRHIRYVPKSNETLVIASAKSGSYFPETFFGGPDEIAFTSPSRDQTRRLAPQNVTLKQATLPSSYYPSRYGVNSSVVSPSSNQQRDRKIAFGPADPHTSVA